MHESTLHKCNKFVRKKKERKKQEIENKKDLHAPVYVYKRYKI